MGTKKTVRASDVGRSGLFLCDLCDLCVNDNFNAEVAEIRRGPQRKAVDLEELTFSAFISIKDPNENGT